MTWKSRIPEMVARFPAAEQAGLRAAAEVLQPAIQQQLQRGFTTGAFTTGSLAREVEVGMTQRGAETVAQVGSPSLVALAWEVGHLNLYTGKYERVPVWERVLVETREAQAQAFAQAFRRVEGW